MIKEIVERFMQAKPQLEAEFAKQHPANYGELVKLTVTAINPDQEYNIPDPERITEIDHGDYCGVLVYVIGEHGYEPRTYWYVRVDYGSCSICDTLQGIRDYDYEPPTSDQVKQYMTLALHIVQRMKVME